MKKNREVSQEEFNVVCATIQGMLNKLTPAAQARTTRALRTLWCSGCGRHVNECMNTQGKKCTTDYQYRQSLTWTKLMSDQTEFATMYLEFRARIKERKDAVCWSECLDAIVEAVHTELGIGGVLLLRESIRDKCRVQLTVSAALEKSRGELGIRLSSSSGTNAERCPSCGESAHPPTCTRPEG